VYGFSIKDICPFIYTLEGNLIGSGSDFMKHVTERFGKHMQIPKDAQQNRSKLNKAETAERIRRKNEGPTHSEKMMARLEEVL